jgi:hypothetical protein
VAFALLAWWLLTLRPVPTSVSTPDQAPAAPLVATP